ncbi:hypothetical protein ACTFIY_005601 [Dictyostelium cf. discoideum]
MKKQRRVIAKNKIDKAYKDIENNKIIKKKEIYGITLYKTINTKGKYIQNKLENGNDDDDEVIIQTQLYNDDDDNNNVVKERDDSDDDSIQSSPPCAQPLPTPFYDDGSTPLSTPLLIPERLQYPTSQNLTSTKRITTRLRYGFEEIKFNLPDFIKIKNSILKETEPKNMVSENVIDLVLIIMFNLNGYFKNDTLAKHKISIIKIINLNHLEANHLIGYDYIYIIIDSLTNKNINHFSVILISKIDHIIIHLDSLHSKIKNGIDKTLFNSLYKLFQSLGVLDYLKYTFTIQEQNKSNNNCGFFTVFNILSTIKYIINNNKKPLISQNKLNIDSSMYDFYPEDFRIILNNTLKEFYKLKDLNLNNLLYCFNIQKKKQN